MRVGRDAGEGWTVKIGMTDMTTILNTRIQLIKWWGHRFKSDILQKEYEHRDWTGK
jgi:hypothetical protein